VALIRKLVARKYGPDRRYWPRFYGGAMHPTVADEVRWFVASVLVLGAIAAGWILIAG
jgi:hypothetical protein